MTTLLAGPALLLSRGSGLAQLTGMPPDVRSGAQQIAIDAYIYGYSMMTTEVTRVQMSNVSKVEGLHAPTGEFINVKRYPPATPFGMPTLWTALQQLPPARTTCSPHGRRLLPGQLRRCAYIPSTHPGQQNTPWLISSPNDAEPIVSCSAEDNPPLPDVEKSERGGSA
jgi:hypothetical protein